MQSSWICTWTHQSHLQSHSLWELGPEHKPWLSDGSAQELSPDNDDDDDDDDENDDDNDDGDGDGACGRCGVSGDVDVGRGEVQGECGVVGTRLPNGQPKFENRG